MSSHHGFVSILVGIGILVSGVVIAGLVVVYEFFPNSIAPRVERTPSSTPLPSIHEVAEKQGFKILYMDPEDQTGRTVLTLGRGLYDGVGVVLDEGGFPKYIVGRVVSIERIPGLRDFYMILEDPVTGSNIPKIRITRESGIPSERSHKFTTPVYVDPFVGEQNPRREFLGYMGEYDDDLITFLIQEGDALALELFLLTPSSRFETSTRFADFVRKDDTGAWLASKIGIRRLGGRRSVIEKLKNLSQ